MARLAKIEPAFLSARKEMVELTIKAYLKDCFAERRSNDITNPQRVYQYQLVQAAKPVLTWIVTVSAVL
jgi:hypothetical protein